MGKTIWHIYEWVYDSILLPLRPYREMIERACASLNRQGGKRFLDAGCGTGNLLCLLAGSDRDLALAGADYSPSMLKKAAKKLKHSKDPVNLHELDLNNQLPFEDAAFDGIASINVLYAIEKPDLLLSELNRILAEQGRLVLVSPLHDPTILPVIGEHIALLKEDYPQTWRLHFTRLIVKIIAPSVIGILVNLLIKKNKNYFFYDQAEISALVGKHGFRTLSFDRVYGNQNFFVVAEKLPEHLLIEQAPDLEAITCTKQ